MVLRREKKKKCESGSKGDREKKKKIGDSAVESGTAVKSITARFVFPPFPNQSPLAPCKDSTWSFDPLKRGSQEKASGPEKPEGVPSSGGCCFSSPLGSARRVVSDRIPHCEVLARKRRAFKLRFCAQQVLATVLDHLSGAIESKCQRKRLCEGGGRGVVVKIAMASIGKPLRWPRRPGAFASTQAQKLFAPPLFPPVQRSFLEEPRHHKLCAQSALDSPRAGRRR